MKPKTLAAVIAALAVCAALVFELKEDNASLINGPRSGGRLLDEDLIPLTGQIILASEGGERVALQREDKQWIVSSHFGIPADVDRVHHLLRQLMNAELGRVISDAPDTLKRLGVGKYRLQLSTVKGEPLGSFRLGNLHASGGCYIAFEEETTTYLLLPALELSAAVIDWAVRRPLRHLQISDLASVELQLDAVDLELSRSNADEDFGSPQVMPSERIRTHKLKRLIRHYLNVELIDVVAENAPIFSSYKLLVFKTFDGRTYRLKIHDSKDAQYIEYETSDKSEPAIHALNKHNGMIKVKRVNNVRIPNVWADLVEERKVDSK